MPEGPRLEIAATVVLQKAGLDRLLHNISAAGFALVGPQVRAGGITYDDMEGASQLPRGWSTEQAPGRFRLIRGSHDRYFDFIPGSESWKRFLFPPQLDLFTIRRVDGRWVQDSQQPAPEPRAFIGVRACELAAIGIQDRVFLRSDFADPAYRARRAGMFILAVDCLHPAGTCFCATMSTGPRVTGDFDLCLTELDEVFLLRIGSEAGARAALDLPVEPSTPALAEAAMEALARAIGQTRSKVDPARCADAVLSNLESDHWESVAGRCLSCGNCTMVCPTCFCWDVTDQEDIKGTEARRVRTWDSCFNPGYSHQAGGNTRPSIRSRYRQWLSHKFGNWQKQFGTAGCVGCGRCITWCPAAIDTRVELSAFLEEAAT
jgi:sulfhydrogenase subunit beta (sulfur reductase)